MLTDTHCHINMIIKEKFDVPLPSHFKELTQPILENAKKAKVTHIINVGTSVQESKNCIELAKIREGYRRSI